MFIRLIFCMELYFALFGCAGCIQSAAGPENACRCGASCRCATTPNNPNCACDTCRCDAGPESVIKITDGDAKRAEASPFRESPDAPAARFTGMICVHDDGACPHCDRQRDTLRAMPAWKDRIRVITDGDQARYGLGELHGLPFWAVLIDGRIVRAHTGYLSAQEIADLNAGQPLGTHAAKVSSMRAGYPLRGGWWTHPGDVRSHLIQSHGQSPEYVRSLSDAEAESLHSDLHEGRTRAAIAPRRAPRFCPSCPKE